MKHPDKVNSLHDGIQHLYFFKNGFGASVVSHRFSYGGDEGLWELAVIRHNDSGGYDLCYSTPITNDVEGWLTAEMVEEYLDRIERLNEDGTENEL